MESKDTSANVVVYALGLILIVFSGWRTIDFISLTLPASAQWVGWFALVAFDGGAVGWTYVYKQARGNVRRLVSGIMIAICLSGVATGLAADTFLQSAKSGTIDAKPDSTILSYAIGLLIAVVFANIVAAIVYDVSDPKNALRRAENEAKDEIDRNVISNIRKTAGNVAAEVAPTVAGAWAAEVRYRNLQTAQSAIAALPPVNVNVQSPTPMYSTQPQPAIYQQPIYYPAQMPVQQQPAQIQEQQEVASAPANFIQYTSQKPTQAMRLEPTTPDNNTSNRTPKPDNRQK